MTPAVLFLVVAIGAPPADFRALTLAGDGPTGSLSAMGADGGVTIAGRALAAGEWYSLRRAGVPLPPWPRAAHAEFANGDRVVGAAIESDGSTLHFRPDFGPGPAAVAVRFSLSAVRALWVRPHDAGDDDPAWLSAVRRTDVIQSRGGDIVRGAIAGLDADGTLRFQTDGKDQRLDLAKIEAIGFNADLARVRKPKGPYYRVTLANGTRLSLLTIRSDGRDVAGETLAKDALSIPIAEVVAIDVDNGKAVSLSDLKPTKYEYDSYDGEKHTWVPDRSVAGRPLVLLVGGSESTFDRGLGLHAACRLTYSLAGKYRRLEMLVGLDARTGAKGEAVMKVILDGKERELPSRGELKSAAPLDLRLDVTGVKEITIVVERGAGGHVQDHVDVVGARLVP